MPKLTPSAVSKLLKARGLKATPDETQQLTQMMNADLEREAEEAERVAALERSERANARFFDEIWAPVLKERKPRKA